MTIITPYFLTREPTSGNGTFGKLTDEAGNVLCMTAELPWLNNEPRHSCIPVGTYTVIPHNSPDHPNTWEIENVPGRSAILLHNGNRPLRDSMGCILVGDSDGIIDGYPAVLNSVVTLEKLRHILPPRFILTIKWREL